MTINNDFIDRVFRMSCQEVEDYAQDHGITVEDFLFLLSDLLEVMEDQEICVRCDRHGIDYDKALGILQDALKRHQ